MNSEEEGQKIKCRKRRMKTEREEDKVKGERRKREKHEQ